VIRRFYAASYRFFVESVDPVASFPVRDQLHARAIFSLISDKPDSTTFVCEVIKLIRETAFGPNPQMQI
jgi:hypothetical protein